MTPSPRTNRYGKARFWVYNHHQRISEPGQRAKMCENCRWMSCSPSYLNDFFVCLIVNFYCGYGFLHLTQDHVHVLIVRLRNAQACQLQVHAQTYTKLLSLHEACRAAPYHLSA